MLWCRLTFAANILWYSFVFVVCFLFKASYLEAFFYDYEDNISSQVKKPEN